MTGSDPGAWTHNGCSAFCPCNMNELLMEWFEKKTVKEEADGKVDACMEKCLRLKIDSILWNWKFNFTVKSSYEYKVNYKTYSTVKSWNTHPPAVFFLFSPLILKKGHIWNYVVNKRVVYLWFFSHLLLWWQLSNCLEVPSGAKYLLVAFHSLSGPTHPKPSQLDQTGW